MEASETRLISLPQGGTLEVSMTDQFKIAVRNHFSLEPDVCLDDDHIRMYIFGAVKTAIDKAEEEQ